MHNTPRNNETLLCLMSSVYTREARWRILGPVITGHFRNTSVFKRIKTNTLLLPSSHQSSPTAWLRKCATNNNYTDITHRAADLVFRATIVSPSEPPARHQGVRYTLHNAALWQNSSIPLSFILPHSR